MVTEGILSSVIVVVLGLALQLLFIFAICLLGDRLVSASPE